MECVKTIVNSNDLNSFISLPRSFLNRKIEVLITPIDESENASSDNIIEDCIQDAYARYKIVNNKESLYKMPKKLVTQLKKINYAEKPLISIRDDSVKITLFYNEKKYVIDYKDLCPNIVFISNICTEKDKREMNVQEVSVEKLASYFG